MRIVWRGFDAQRIDVAANRLATVLLCGCSQDAPVATAKVVNNVVLVDLGQPEHGSDHIRRSRDVDDIRRPLQRLGWTTRFRLLRHRQESKCRQDQADIMHSDNLPFRPGATNARIW